jgi:ABC-type dipeptide/oligopeptide/nickel transport system permease component
MNIIAAPIMAFVGIWLGTISGIRRDTWVDHTTRIFAIIGWSLPTFLFALVMLMVFYGYFQIFDPGVLNDQLSMFITDNPDKFTRYTGMYMIDGILNWRWIYLGRLFARGDAGLHLCGGGGGHGHAGDALGPDRGAWARIM